MRMQFYFCYNFAYNSTVGACTILDFCTFTILHFYNFQASLNLRANACTCYYYYTQVILTWMSSGLKLKTPWPWGLPSLTSPV
jgi:hypothetical protein